MTFQVGDKVIYPNHGLGIVERIEDKTILGTTCGFYHLRIVANDTTVLVPLSNVDGVGLRRAISDDEVDRLFGLLGLLHRVRLLRRRGRLRRGVHDRVRLSGASAAGGGLHPPRAAMCSLLGRTGTHNRFAVVRADVRRGREE